MVDRLTHRQLSEELQNRFPGSRGCSIPSIKLFCSQRGIHKTSRLSNADVENVVADAIAKVLCLRSYIPILNIAIHLHRLIVMFLV